jgi:hypothetical protein
VDGVVRVELQRRRKPAVRPAVKRRLTGGQTPFDQRSNTARLHGHADDRAMGFEPSRRRNPPATETSASGEFAQRSTDAAFDPLWLRTKPRLGLLDITGEKGMDELLSV